MDAITLLRNDHRTVEKLFKKFEKSGDRAYKTKQKLVELIIEELSVHAAIEEEIFYPDVRDAAGETEEMVLESLYEHHIVKWTLSELEDMDPKDERFDAKVTVLIESVRHHKNEEEEDLFKRVRRALSPAELREMGERLEKAKLTAPARPHPRAPDTPPGNMVAGKAAAAVDRGKDLVRDLVRDQ
jgi:hemerythrin superfamily protein